METQGGFFAGSCAFGLRFQPGRTRPHPSRINTTEAARQNNANRNHLSVNLKFRHPTKLKRQARRNAAQAILEAHNQAGMLPPVPASRKSVITECHESHASGENAPSLRSRFRSDDKRQCEGRSDPDQCLDPVENPDHVVGIAHFIFFAICFRNSGTNSFSM